MFTWFALFLAVADAAPAGVHALTVASTPRLTVRRDEAFSPRTWTAPTLAAGALGWTYDGPVAAHRVGLDVAWGVARSGRKWSFSDPVTDEVMDTAGTPMVQLRLHYGGLHRFDLDGPVDVALGGGPDVDLNTASYAFGRGGMFTYFSAIGANVDVEVGGAVHPDHRLDLAVSVPVVAWVSRSPYAINDEQYIASVAAGSGVGGVFALIGRGRMTSWEARQAARASLRWTWTARKVTPQLSLDGAVQRHHDGHDELIHATVGLSLGGRFMVGGAR